MLQLTKEKITEVTTQQVIADNFAQLVKDF